MQQKSPKQPQIKLWEVLFKKLQTLDKQGAQSLLQLKTTLFEEFGIQTKTETIAHDMASLSRLHPAIKKEVRRQGPKRTPTNFYYFQNAPTL